MRLLGASFKKTVKKPTACGYAAELTRLDSGVERTIGTISLKRKHYPFFRSD